MENISTTASTVSTTLKPTRALMPIGTSTKNAGRPVRVITIIAPAAPAIAESLGVEAVQINVAMTAYLLTVAVLIPASGWLSDRYGARGIFSLAIAVFTVASVGCAVSPSLPVLLFFRAIQGLAAGAGQIISRAMVRDVFSDDHHLLRRVLRLWWWWW